MPLQYLASIKFSSTYAPYRLTAQDDVADAIEGIYQFELADFNCHVALFNDGYPALMIMPNPSMVSACHVGEQYISLGSMWFTAGVLRRAIWQPGQYNGMLTVIRFYPGVWQRLTGKPAVQFPFVHDLATYAPTFSRQCIRFYDEPRIDLSIHNLLAQIMKNGRDNVPIDKPWKKLLEYPNDPHAREDYCLSKKGYYSKSVQRLFKRTMGLGPYQFEQLHRFLRAFYNLKENKNVGLHEMAFLCGYYDANHLIKDFKKYVGKSPRLFLLQETV
ncbi:helix-turn-helix domain-containing protein [Sphingobacterium suaedae]|uniref:Helix-turn-helix domain-containing protein n=1 Tax=Sphingobacterium suaedae TaxID=1686402 RepID=A0ABW5KFI3_9SPHI